ncbi:galactokinase [Streptobacillus felis]|uniref:Galactokinase n=1 Tax=Streptobacillus felis TaxID=1384509 RepID=A0A7Z0PFC6_9FUSO|nr:galactokinase [Streptobacillus felis]NYV28182.1 galactokinase [Streptobacillus felis]
MLKVIENRFNELFGRKYESRYFAPGRVNLIGEHTDYNGGNVFPCAIDRGTIALVAKREDRKCRFYSENFVEKGVIEFDIDVLVNDPAHDWVNYPKGMFKAFIEKGYDINHGFDVLLYGDIPNGAGLSSSASVEMVIGILLREEFKFDIDTVEIVKLGKLTENEFIGVNSGIMDQFAVAMGKKDMAILLDCNTLVYEYVPVVLENEYIIIANTNKRRGLADSKYNERRSECDMALEELQTKLDIKALGELSIEEFEANKDLIKSDIRQKRAKHAVYENQRTLMAKEALTKGDLETFGKLMNESHISLRDDYEVTGKELDSLVEAAWEEEGVVGSRMTGAGFGGCTVSIVKKMNVDMFIENVGRKYFEKTGLKADFYIANVSEGARTI